MINFNRKLQIESEARERVQKLKLLSADTFLMLNEINTIHDIDVAKAVIRLLLTDAAQSK